ncbi:ABC transporter permease [Sedimentibacter sp. B4]|uniref:ABC transporter permease n=1 Tax=Sedimentibacter sp. B4 TaxID=304766 RepID=UPI0003052AA5|nr:ABC transporter permease [Sedimentibacter sp. B4]
MMTYKETFIREFRSIFKYKGMMILLFIGPIFLTLFFGGVYYNDYVKDIPIAILDEDGSTLSNLVGSYFLSNERFEVTNYPATRKELENLIDDGKVQMGICIPKGFESKVSTYQSSQILAITDGTNIVMANNAIAQATLITQSISAGIEMKLIQGKGVSPKTAQDMALVYNVGERMLFDPKMTYMNYLMICFLAVFVQQLMLSAMGSTFIRDNEYINSGNVMSKVLAAVSACFVGILPAVAVSMVILRKLFYVPMVGNIWTVLLMTVVFLIALTGPSLLIASMTKDRVKYSQIEFMLSLPTFCSCGGVWPVDQMPRLLEFLIRACWPVINYAKVVQEVLIKGMSFSATIPNILQMVLFAMVWLPIGIFFYKKTFNQVMVPEIM